MSENKKIYEVFSEGAGEEEPIHWAKQSHHASETEVS